MGKFASGRKLRGCGCLGVQGVVAGPDLVPAVCLLVREDNDWGLGASAEIKQTCTWGGPLLCHQTSPREDMPAPTGAQPGAGQWEEGRDGGWAVKR